MDIITFIKVVFLGIVEGITEWLPISSTGHMILVNELIKLNVTEEFWEVFEVVIQLGAVMAVVVIFWNKIFPFDAKPKAPAGDKGVLSYVDKDIFTLWLKIITACLPALVFVALGLDDWCEEHFYNYVCVAIALIVFGIAFIVVENLNKNKEARITSLDAITYKTALLIGIFQLIAAAFPGTSRSGATIVGALLIGVSRTVAAEYTFFLAIPVMFGASLLKILKYGLAFAPAELIMLITGMAVAFAVSIFVIKFLLGFIKKNDFKPFGWYRIALGVIVLLYFIIV